MLSILVAAAIIVVGHGKTGGESRVFRIRRVEPGGSSSLIVVIEVREPEEKPGLDRPGFSHAQC
ncbi:hypothetical protein ACP810_23210, partial [Escherichia coli]